MKLTKEQLQRIIKEELNSIEESEILTMSGSESANMLRQAVEKFVMDNPQLDDPKRTVMAIINELIK